MIYKGVRAPNPILACALSLTLILSFASIRASSAQTGPAYIRRVPSLKTEGIGSLHPVGLSFSSRSKTFYVIEDQGQSPITNSDVIGITALADRKGSVRVAALIQ